MDERHFKEKLNPEQYRIMRQKGTEMPHVGKYWDNTESGVYFCAACGNKLFSSLAKFDSGDGWPAFRNPTSEKNVELVPDGKGGTEILCRKCRSHLGEVVGEGEQEYYRVNSVCLDFREVGIEFEEKEGEDEEGGGAGKKEKPKQDDKNPARKKSPHVKTISLIAGGFVAGVIIGAGFVIALCQTTEVNFESENTPLAPTVLVEPISVVETKPTAVNASTLPRSPTMPTGSMGAATSAETTRGGATSSSPEGGATTPAENITTDVSTVQAESSAGTISNSDGTAPSNDGTIP